jgi:hypothetical protein
MDPIMAERWVSKLEATTLFKVTERTLDNWVKSEKMQKARHKGQIMYEISQCLEEKVANEAQFESFTSTTESKISTPPPPPQEPDEVINVEEQVLKARLEEKIAQISMLSETLEKRQKDLNTLVMERGSLSEKSTQLLIETETLRKERETLQKEKELISEKSYRKIPVIMVFVATIILIFSVSSVMLWKYFDEKKQFEREVVEAKDRALKQEERVKLGEAEAKKLVKEKEELAEKVSEVKQKEALAIQKASEASERLSEIKKEKDALLKDAETLQKTLIEQQKENQDLKLKVKITEALEQNKNPDKTLFHKRETEKQPVKEKAVENPGILPTKGTD